MVATGAEAEGLRRAGPGAASFAARCFDEAACLAEVLGFDEATCLVDLPCVFWKMSDTQPATLISVGRNTDAATAAIKVR
jgi:hypothetical protein